MVYRSIAQMDDGFFLSDLPLHETFAVGYASIKEVLLALLGRAEVVS